MSTSGSKIGKKISSFFFEEDDNVTTETSSEETSSVQAKETTDEIPNYTPKYSHADPPTLTSNQPAKNEKIYKIIKDVLRDANLPGPDYLELTDTMTAFIENGMDEMPALKNAFIALKISGLTKETVLSSGKHYLDILEKERQDFGNNILQEEQSKINAPQKEISDIEDTNTKLQNDISKITSQINSNNILIEQKKREMSENTIKIQSKKKDFEFTLALFTTEIQKNLDRVGKI